MQDRLPWHRTCTSGHGKLFSKCLLGHVVMVNVLLMKRFIFSSLLLVSSPLRKVFSIIPIPDRNKSRRIYGSDVGRLRFL